MLLAVVVLVLKHLVLCALLLADGVGFLDIGNSPPFEREERSVVLLQTRKKVRLVNPSSSCECQHFLLQCWVAHSQNWHQFVLQYRLSSNVPLLLIQRKYVERNFIPEYAHAKSSCIDQALRAPRLLETSVALIVLHDFAWSSGFIDGYTWTRYSRNGVENVL